MHHISIANQIFFSFQVAIFYVCGMKHLRNVSGYAGFFRNYKLQFSISFLHLSL